MNWIRQICFLGAACLAAGGPVYTLADLGTLGGSSMTATGVNAFGQTAGTATNMFGTMLAFSSNGSGLTMLAASSATQSEAAGINDSGQIAGTQYAGNQTYATVWNNGVATTVGGAGSFATGISDSGEVSGMLVNNGQGNAFVAVNGTVIDLGTFAGGVWSSAYGVNDAGQAVGYGMTAGGNFRGFIWTPGQGYAVLGTLGGASSYAMAIDEAGLVTGNSQTSSGYSHAFVSNGTSMEDLGTLGGVASYGYGINDAGNIVGSSYTTGNASVDGFLEEGGVMYDINSLMIDAPGWQITALYGINDSNQVVGVGILNGIEHAVLLTDPPAPGVSSDAGSSTTPEPAAWICTIAGLAVLVARATRSASPPQRLRLDRLRGRRQ